MSFNPFKPFIQNIQELFSNNINKVDKSDKEMECLQFGNCTVHVQSPRPEELFFR